MALTDAQLHDIITQHNLLIANQNKKDTENYIEGGIAEDKNALENKNVAPDTSAQSFPQNLQAAGQELQQEGEPGLQPPQSQEVGVPSLPYQRTPQSEDPWYSALTSQLSRGPAEENIPMQRPNPFSSGEQLLTPNLPSDVAKREAAPSGQLVGQIQTKSPSIATGKQVNRSQLESGEKQLGSIGEQNVANLGEMPERARIYKQGLAEEAQGRKDIAEEQVRLNASQQNSAQNLQAKFLNQSIDASKNFMDTVNSMTSVNPNRIFNDTSTGGKIGFIVSAMAGGLQTGGALDNAIKNDIQAQVQTNNVLGAKANNFMSVLEKFTGNTMDAAKMANSFYHMYAENMLKAKQAEIDLSENILTKKTLEWLMPQMQQNIENKLKVASATISAAKEETATTKAGNEATKADNEARLNKYKEDVEAGKVDDSDKSKIEQIDNISSSLNRINEIRRSGFHPEGYLNNFFIRNYIDPSKKSQAVATLITMGMKKEDITKAEDYANNIEMLMRHQMEEEGLKRGAAWNEEAFQRKLGTTLSTPESLNLALIQYEGYARSAVLGLNPKSIRRLQENAPESQNVIQRPNQKVR